MVEENEIRVGLSYYERARIAAKAADAGVHPDRRTAVRALFAAASRAKRSKIASFLALHDALDDRLRFPAAIPERLGLALSRALEADPSLREKLRERLRKAACDTADAELALLVRAVKGGGEPKGNSSLKGRSETNSAPIDTLARPEDAEEPRRGVWLQSEGGFLRQRLTLSGPRVDAAFRARLVAWLRGEGGQS